MPKGQNFVNSDDMITRHGSSSAILIEGVTSGEAADLSTIWTMIDFPSTCLTIPAWVKGEKELPVTLTVDGNSNCPLNELALQLKNCCYPIQRSSGYKYLNISELINREGSGIIQQLERAEYDIFNTSANKLANWHINPPSVKDLQEAYYHWLDEAVISTYNHLNK